MDANRPQPNKETSASKESSAAKETPANKDSLKVSGSGRELTSNEPTSKRELIRVSKEKNTTPKKQKLAEGERVYQLFATDGMMIEKYVKLNAGDKKKIVKFKSDSALKMAKFQSNDGEIECSENDAKLSPFLANLIDNASRNTSSEKSGLMIPSDIKFDTFEKVIEYCVLHISFLTQSKQSVPNLSTAFQVSAQLIEPAEPQASTSSADPQQISSIQPSLSTQSTLDNDEKLYQRRKKERDYLSDIQFDQIRLFDLVRAAEKLQIEDLLNLTCETVANNFVKGKSIEQTRALFNIECDLTPDEINRIDIENNFYDKDFDF